MATLKQFSVYLNPRDPRPMETAVFVREGFNFWAVFLGIFWTLYNRLWLASGVIVVIAILDFAAKEQHWLTPASLAVIKLGMHIILGYIAGDLHAAKLRSRGYVLSDYVSGTNLAASQQRYFDRVTAAA